MLPPMEVRKAVLLAAGRGTRLGALTAHTPKPLLEVAGKPLIAHIVNGLVAGGIHQFVIVSGYLGDQIERWAGGFVAANSGIAGVRDLSGKTIAVSSPRGLDQLVTVNFIDKGGGDSTSVRFTELPPTASVEAVRQNRIAAAVAVPPMLEAALATDMRSLGDVEAAVAPIWAGSGWFSTAEYVQTNPGVVRRFVAAIYEAGAWSLANRSAAAAVLSKALGAPVPQTYVHLATKADPSLFQPPLDIAARYGYVVATKSTALLWDGG